MVITPIYSQDARLLGWIPQSFANIGQRVFNIVQILPKDTKFGPVGTAEGIINTISLTRCSVRLRDRYDEKSVSLYVVSQDTKEHLLADTTFIPVTAEMMS